MFLTFKGVEGSSDASGNIGEMITLEHQFRGYANGLVVYMWTRGENALAVSDKFSIQYMEEVSSENGVEAYGVKDQLPFTMTEFNTYNH